MPEDKSTAARKVRSGSTTEKYPPVSPEERYRMIAEAAYFRAEKRGFVGGDIAEDWVQAEAEIDRILQAREKGQGMTPTTQEIEQQVQAAIESDTAAISERVRAITLQALSGGELDKKALKQVMAAVVKGAQQGATHRAEHGALALKEAMRGLDDALAVAAEATQLAIGEAAGRTGEFSRRALKGAADDLAALESLFIETLGSAAKSATGIARTTLRELADHARASGTAVGGRVESALSQLAHAIADTAREQMETGTQALRKEATMLAGLAAGALRGIADRLQSTPVDKTARPSSGKRN